MKRRIRVHVGPGVFSNERSVWFEAGGRRYNLIVDQNDVNEQGSANGELFVSVVAEGPEEAIIDLPRDTFTSGSRIRVPKNVLMAT